MARLGIFALLVQSLLVATHLPSGATSPFSDPAAWCLSGPAAAPGIPGAPAKVSHKVTPCTLCQVLNAAATGLAPAEFIVLAPQSPALSFVSEAAPSLSSSVDYLAAPPRAPPSFV